MNKTFITKKSSLTYFAHHLQCSMLFKSKFKQHLVELCAYAALISTQTLKDA